MNKLKIESRLKKIDELLTDHWFSLVESYGKDVVYYHGNKDAYLDKDTLKELMKYVNEIEVSLEKGQICLCLLVKP